MITLRNFKNGKEKVKTVSSQWGSSEFLSESKYSDIYQFSPDVVKNTTQEKKSQTNLESIAEHNPASGRLRTCERKVQEKRIKIIAT